MSLIYDDEAEAVTEYQWNLLRERIATSERERRYQATKQWLAGAGLVGLAILAAWSWWQMPL